MSFLDTHWIEYDWHHHVEQTAKYRPWIVVVPDLIEMGDIDRVLRQAEDLAQFTEHVMIVPKVSGSIERLPKNIGGKSVVLGFSVPTQYGGTDVPLWEFHGWPVHLLGGNARRQADLCRYLKVISVDGNIAWRLARRGIIINENGAAGKTIKQSDGERWPETDAHLEALRRSFVNLRKFWSKRANIEWNCQEVNI